MYILARPITWELRFAVHKMGMKYCKRKIPRLRKSLFKSSYLVPCIRENQEEFDNEMWSVERSSYTIERLGQILKLEIIKKFCQY